MTRIMTEGVALKKAKKKKIVLTFMIAVNGNRKMSIVFSRGLGSINVNLIFYCYCYKNYYGSDGFTSIYLPSFGWKPHGVLESVKPSICDGFVTYFL